eukprot:COSAG05_NODE_1696_length_4261_cov_2.865596_6_plen_48_part_00
MGDLDAAWADGCGISPCEKWSLGTIYSEKQIATSRAIRREAFTPSPI